MMGISKIKANSNSQETTRRRAPKKQRERKRERGRILLLHGGCVRIYILYIHIEILRGERFK